MLTSVFEATRFRRKLLLLCLVIFCFSIWPFFWSSTAPLISKAIHVGSAAAIAAIFFISRPAKLRINAFVIMFGVYLGLCLFATAYSEHDSIQAKFWTRALIYTILMLCVITLSSLGTSFLSRASQIISWLFTAFSVPSILLFLLVFFSIEVPFTQLTLGSREPYYRLYPLGIITDYTIAPLCKNLQLARVNGFSEEPGVLGTFSVFFIILNYFFGHPKFKMLQTVLLSALGTLSFSLFFFVASWIVFPIAAMLGMLENFRTRKFKPYLPLLAGAAVSISITASLMAISQNQCHSYTTVSLYTPLYRLQPSKDGSLIVGNNRFVYEKNFIHSIGMDKIRRDKNAPGIGLDIPLGKLLFGHGPGANSMTKGYASWTAEVYDTGILSLLAVLTFYGWVLFKALFYQRRFSLFYPALLSPAVLSFYQRPEVITPIIVFFWIAIAGTLKSRKKQDDEGASIEARLSPGYPNSVAS